MNRKEIRAGYLEGNQEVIRADAFSRIAESLKDIQRQLVLLEDTKPVDINPFLDGDTLSFGDSNPFLTSDSDKVRSRAELFADWVREIEERADADTLIAEGGYAYGLVTLTDKGESLWSRYVEIKRGEGIQI